MKMKSLLFLALTLTILSLVSAVYLIDAGIRYSYGDSFGTGIAVSENGFWISNTPNLTIGQSHTIKYYIDNKIPNTIPNVRVIVRLDSEVITDYSVNIIDSHTKTINLDIDRLECNSLHTIYLEIQDSNDDDCDTGDNCAQRGIIVSCGEPGPICGDSVLEGNEECDSGANNGKLCSAGYNSFCNYCSNYCEIETVKGEFCGDGILNAEHEKCDDGNQMNGDGCSVTCKKEGEIEEEIDESVTTEDFVPLVWLCDSRIVYDDGTEPGRVSEDGTELVERINNYAFEGEQIQWKVLVMDKNGIDKVRDVYATIDGNIEADCARLTENNLRENNNNKIDPSCNAKILEEEITEFNSETMAYYICTLTVETPESMYDEYYITVEAEDVDGLLGTMDETEYWFLNPSISLDIQGAIAFDSLREGTSGYSRAVLVGNDADMGSGVLLDMFISGTDFYDSSNSENKCPTTNQLSLGNFRYYASKGAYSTKQDLGQGRTCDAEGYCPINYGIGFNNPNPFYDKYEIIQAKKIGPYYTANLLSPGSEMSLIFRLDLPEPCNGDFDAGQIYFWGEAV